MKITRRHVLASMALVPVASALGLSIRWWNRPAGVGYQKLAEDEAHFVRQLAEAWMPRGGTPKISGADAGLDHYFDAILPHITPFDCKSLKLLIQALDDATLPTHFAAFRHLELSARQSVLKEWTTSSIAPLRSAVQALLVLMSEAYFLHPDVQMHTQDWFACGYGRQ